MIGSSLQTLGAATEKARLSKLSFVLGTISCEIDVKQLHLAAYGYLKDAGD